MESLKPDAKQVSLAEKKPVAYMLVLALLMLGVVTYKLFQAQDARPADCNQFNAILLKRIQVLEARLDDRDNVILQLKHNTDSLIRATIGEKSKTLLKKSKQRHEN